MGTKRGVTERAVPMSCVLLASTSLLNRGQAKRAPGIAPTKSVAPEGVHMQGCRRHRGQGVNMRRFRSRAVCVSLFVLIGCLSVPLAGIGTSPPAAAVSPDFSITTTPALVPSFSPSILIMQSGVLVRRQPRSPRRALDP